MKRTTTILISMLVIMTLFLSACASTPAATAEPTAAPVEATEAAAATEVAATEQASILVGTDATFAPYESMDDAGNMIGIDIELMTLIAEKMGVQIEWANLPFDSVMAGMTECQYDAAIAAIYVTDLRKETMLFTDPYSNAGMVVSVNSSNTTVNGLEDLKGLTVAAQLGTTGEATAQTIENVTYKPYDSYELAFMDLANGQVDAVIADTPVAQGYVDANPEKLKIVGEPFESADIAIAVCMTKPELQEQINSALNELIADGTVAEIIKKYNP